jgi:hypothetical protein
MDPSEDSDLNTESDPDNSLKMKVLLAVLSLALIGELIYFTQFSGIKIPFKFPELSFTSLFVFVDSLKKAPPKPTIRPTSIPTKAPNPTTTEIKKLPTVLEFEGIITTINSIKIINSPTSSESSENKIEFSFNLESGDTEWAKQSKIFFFNKTELNTMKVFDTTGKIISYKDLKVDQTIKIIQKYGLVEPPHVNIEIHVLK